ncbi:MAG: hypothetical protein JWO56_909 [Acidobacteria bacterium]|nr:hypothetical protein [Acidobacteriota bacterium]
MHTNMIPSAGVPCYNRIQTPMRKAIPILAACLLTVAAHGATKRVGNPARPSLREASIENATSCDLSTTPAATLLLPYFEVDIHQAVNDATNTIFAVVNTVRTPQIARVTLWTDQGYPVLWFNLFLTGYDVQSISLYDVLSRGAIPITSSAMAHGARSSANGTNAHVTNLESCASPGGMLDASSLEAIQAMLTTGVRAGSTCRIGGDHAHATGYITIDLVSSCSAVSPLDPSYYAQVILFDNVLTGDYERIAPERTTGNFAGGSPLVHIKAVPEGGDSSSYITELPYTFYDRFTGLSARRVDRRQPLPSSFAARFIQGGTGQFFTDYMVWRESSTAPASMISSTCSTAAAAMPVSSAVRFDENENPTVAASGLIALPSASLVSTSGTTFPPLAGATLSGWMMLNLDNRALISASGNARPSQNWVVVHLSAEGRYGVDYDATALSNGCSSQAATVVEQSKEIR